MTVFAGVFKPAVGDACESDNFEGVAGVVFEFFTDFGPFGLRQDAAVEPLLFVFQSAGRHAGLGGGLMLRMAAMICPNTSPLTATSAS